MALCTHRIALSFKSIVTLESVFRCKLCGEYVELTKGWRITRAAANTFCIFAVLYAAFSKLQGTLGALAVMLALIAACVLLFLIVNYLILSLAPFQIARDEVNPDLLGLYDDAEDGPLYENEGVEEDVLPEELRRRRLQDFAREQDRRLLQRESYEDAERNARKMQAEMAEEARRVQQMWESDAAGEGDPKQRP